MADRDTAAGFGATAETRDNSDQINDLLDQVRDLMAEDGVDYATAEALTNFARPAGLTITGNLADLQRMGSIVHQGKIHTPAGQPDIEASSLEEAFTEVPPTALAPAGLQTPLGSTEAGVSAEAEAEGGGLDSMTKSELLDEAESRGIEVSSSWTKQEIIDRINEG